jgi:hypothetical protein
MLASICRCCGQPGLVLQAQAGRFFLSLPEVGLKHFGRLLRLGFS